MGADWVCLFDKRLCDQILSLTPEKISEFVESHLAELQDLSEFRLGFEQDVPAIVRLEHLREQGRADEELKADLVEHLCASEKRLIIDYWGCYVEVFASDDPPGSIPDYKLFPHIKEQGYLLLRPDHVDSMLTLLEEHRLELRLMDEGQVAQLREWGRQCKEDRGHMVAYFYDF